jgi:hypothetical protein
VTDPHDPGAEATLVRAESVEEAASEPIVLPGG